MTLSPSDLTLNFWKTMSRIRLAKTVMYEGANLSTTKTSSTRSRVSDGLRYHYLLDLGWTLPYFFLRCGNNKFFFLSLVR